MAKRTYTKEDLFIGNFPTGFVYANMAKEVAGDYQRLAYLNYSTLQLEVEKACPAELLTHIRAHHEAMLARRHTVYPIAGNASVVLGGSDLTQAQRDQIYIEHMQR
jgi:hypothetical protein